MQIPIMKNMKSEQPAQPSESNGGLIRELGLTEAFAIGLGTMIGAGIFVLSAIAADRAGPAASLSYLAAGMICILVAMTVAELATGMPKAGGSYHLISRALGPSAGAVVGPGNWLGLTFATGFYLVGFARYVSYFLTIPAPVTVLVAGAFFVFLNYRGAKLSGNVQKVIVAALLAVLALFIVRGLFSVDPQLHRPFVPFGWGAVIANVGLIIVSFTGFEKISTIAEEIKRPERNLPLAIVGSVIVATILYGGVLFVLTGVLPYLEVRQFQAPLVEAANRFMSVVGIIGMSIGALLATASSANAAIMASSRINFAMGRDRILPHWFNVLHPTHLTPHRSVVVTGGLAILLALSGQAELLAEISSALFMVSYALLSLSLIVMRRAQPSWYRPAFRVPLYPYLPVLGGLLSLAVIATMDRISQIAGIGLVAISLAWYWAWGRRKTPVAGELSPWLTRERPVEAVIAATERAVTGRHHEILVPLANPATVQGLMQLGATLAHTEPAGRVVALSIVPVPVNVPLNEAHRQLDGSNPGQYEILQQALECGSPSLVPIDTVLQPAYGIASGIIGVSERRADTRLLLMGWHGPLMLRRIRTSVDKDVIRDAQCDVAVLLNRHLKEIHRVLVPAGGGPHARLGVRLAHDLVDQVGGELVVLRVVPPQTEDLFAEQQALEAIVHAELHHPMVKPTIRTVRAVSIVDGIVREASDGYDLVVIGASEEWFLRNWLVGSIPDVVAERAPCSVLMVRKYEPAPLSRVRRLVKHVRE
jgi:amino acid transporter/nucleotide-binding universal stress UspA family protein